MNQHEIREKVREKYIQLGLDNVSSVNLEKGVFNWCLDFAEKNCIIRNWANNKFMNLYMDKARSIYANLDKDSYIGNQKLLARLKEAEFLPQDIPFTGRETIFPDRWKDAIDKKMKKDEHVYEERPAAMTNQFKCGKCKKRECIFQELQLRSCDEPMTLFITCLNCGNRWRI
jgi:transcription elongation factor S-II